MWNRRINDPQHKNPFENASKNSKSETLTADSVKCPSCGSNIVFEPQISAMVCSNCGNVYSADTMEPRGSLGVVKEHDYTGDSEMSEDDKKRHEIVCNSCGASVVADENTMSTMCPFCGSPALITRRLSREFKPDYIVPFIIDREKAQSIIQNWISSRKHTPSGFRSKCRLTKMTALYVPAWLLDCGVTADLSGTGKNKDGLLTTIYEVNIKLDYHVKNVPFDASLSIANKLMEAVEPYDFSKMVKFESKFLQGFYADKYDQLPTEMTERMMKRIERFTRSESGVAAKKYTEYEDRYGKSFSLLHDISVKYCLLPVWFMTVEFKGEEYQFAVNGQTGEPAGLVPTTESFDLGDKITGWMDTGFKWIPVAVIVLLALILFLFMSAPPVGASQYYGSVILGTCEIIAVLSTIALFLIRYANKNLVHRKRQSVYEANDFDKDPGLDCYFDSTKPSDLKIDEIFLRQVQQITDSNGNVVGERSFENTVR